MGLGPYGRPQPHHHQLLRISVAFPCYGRGLKDIAKCLGFAWRQEDVNALTSMVLYLQYVRFGKAADSNRQKILDYNEDDCLATMHVFDWLLGQD